MNREEIAELKSKHRLECVMIESGEKFESGDRGKLKSLTTPGLVVDTHRQSFTLNLSGRVPEAGDVFTWLRMRYHWSFGQAARYLQMRTPDPARVTEPETKQSKEREIITFQYDKNALDQWQRKALKLFGKDADQYADILNCGTGEIMQYLMHLPSRFLEVIDVASDECFLCGEEFDWGQDDTRAYIEQHMAGEEVEEEDKELWWFENYRFFEMLICKDCMTQHKRNYMALRCLHISAIKRRKIKNIELEEERRRRSAEDEAREQARQLEEDKAEAAKQYADYMAQLEARA